MVNNELRFIAVQQIAGSFFSETSQRRLSWKTDFPALAKLA